MSEIRNIPVIYRRNDTTEHETQVRLTLSFDEAMAHEKDTVIGETYRFWLDACEHPNKLPFASILEQRDSLSPEAQVTASTVIDVSSEDPFQFLILEHRLRTPFGSDNGRRLREIPSQIIRDALLFEYLHVKESEQPAITEVHQWRHLPEAEQNNICRHYVKVDLPVIDPKTGKVSFLLVVSRLIEENLVGLPRRLVNSELIG